MKDLQPIAEFARRVRNNIEKVFLGKTAVVDMLITAFLARGHVLLEDVPLGAAVKVNEPFPKPLQFCAVSQGVAPPVTCHEPFVVTVKVFAPPADVGCHDDGETISA